MSHTTYKIADIEWRVNDTDGLIDAYSIKAGPHMLGRAFVPADDLPVWHAIVAALPEKKWGIIRRRFGIHQTAWSVLREEMQFSKPVADITLLAGECECSVAEVQEAMESALSHWHAAACTTEAAPPLPDAEALSMFGFDNAAVLADEKQSAYLARRIRDLMPVLQTADSRTQARSMLETERQMRYIVEPAISDMQALLDRMRSVQAEQMMPGERKLAKEMSAEERDERDKNLVQMVKAVSTLSEQLDKLIKRHGDMQKVILDASDALGLAELQAVGGAEKMRYTRTLSDLFESCRLWHTNGDRRLIDMMAAEDEVIIMTTPYLDRDPQYRPDIALHLRQMRTELFTGRELIKPATRAAKRLLKGFEQGLRAALEEEGVEITALDDTGATAESAETIAAAPGIGPAGDIALESPVIVRRQDDGDEVA